MSDIVAPLHTDTSHPCVHGCGTRYVVTRRVDGGLELRYAPCELERCRECTRTDMELELDWSEGGGG